MALERRAEDASVSPLLRYQDAFYLARRAAEELGSSRPRHDVALFFCIQAAELFLTLSIGETRSKPKDLGRKYVDALLTRAEALRNEPAPPTRSRRSRSTGGSLAERSPGAALALELALGEDESGANLELALFFYTEAAEQMGRDRAGVATIMERTIERAECISSLLKANKHQDSVQGSAPRAPPDTAGVPTSKSSRLTADETKILRASSKVNKKNFWPWLEGEDGRNSECLDGALFEDPDGILRLSVKQKEAGCRLMRPSQFIRRVPEIVYLISAFSVVQKMVSDCSFVSSLCVTANYERRYKKQLVSNKIFPQRNGIPVYNPRGKYVVKMWFNGCIRKVVIDDLFPVDGNARWLCSYSNNMGELWPSIMEKAYLKVMGGYQFDGSNSGIDLFALTGWIPEVIHIDDKNEFDEEREWTRLVNGHKFGDCLVTIATSKLSSAREEELGLVSTHAYAVLDIKEVSGKRLLQVKNPWTHTRWKGTFDMTSEVKQALGYDVLGALQYDNGIFYIDYASVVQHFRSIYINWNPELFRHRCVFHLSCPLEDKPHHGSRHLARNPQYHLVVHTTERPKDYLWILLSRHTVDGGYMGNDYTTVHLYKDENNGKRVISLSDRIHEGSYTSNPHYLVRLDLDRTTCASPKYLLAVDQLEWTSTLNYTLSIFCTAPFEMNEIPRYFAYQVVRDGEWTPHTAAGSWRGADDSSGPPFSANPHFRLRFRSSSPSTAQRPILLLETREALYVGLRVASDLNGGRIKAVKKTMQGSGAYRPGYAYIELNDILPDVLYSVAVSTFDPGELGAFTLSVLSPMPVELDPTPSEP